MRDAARECRACDLWKLGTQTVFGEGPRRAEPGSIGTVTAVRHDPEAPEGTRWHHDVVFGPSGVWVILNESELMDPDQYRVVE